MKRSKAGGGKTGRRKGKLRKAGKVATFAVLVLLVCGLLVFFSGGSSVRWFGSETEAVSENVGDQVKEGSYKLGGKADNAQVDMRGKASKAAVALKDYVKESAHKIKRSIADKLKGSN
jgi:hypothetical protein